MGQKAATVKAALPQPRVYKSSPLLVKGGKRSRQEALPSALHMGICVGLCLLIFAIVNICVTELLSPLNPFVKLVQSGTMMAMITITVLGTPNLGNSFTKAAQRIAGVMIGGWLFYGLYAACQAWWFLVICLTVWAFILVAASFALSGREFMFPVALVTAFIVVCNFNSVQQALVMTIVKTVAFAGAIALYTVVALLMFPLTATQQLLANLASALKDIEQLADLVLVTGEHSDTSAQGSTQTAASPDPEAQPTNDAVAATDGMGIKAADIASKGTAAGKAGRGGRKGKKAAPPNAAVSLAANANHKLQLVQSLLRMTKKERYIGTIGSYKFFLPTLFLKSGVLPEDEVLAVVVNAGQVLRVLVTIMSDFGSVPMARRLPPTTLSARAAEHMQPLAQQAVVSLQDISAGLPVSGNSSYPVPVSSLQDYAAKLQQLVSDSVSHHNNQQGATEAPAASASAPAAAAAAGAGADTSSAAPASTVAGKWQQAAVAASGMKLPPHRTQQLAAAFSTLLTEAVRSEEGQVARWCSVLVLSRQLGRSIAGLNDSVNEMLAKLPWMNAGAVM